MTRKLTGRAPDAGFTLIETLVALAILALSSVALLGATEAYVARIGAVEVRAAAGWAAENHLAELSVGLEPEPAPAAMLGFEFQIETVRTLTSDTDLDRVDLLVTNTADGQRRAALTGFLDTRAAQGTEP